MKKILLLSLMSFSLCALSACDAATDSMNGVDDAKVVSADTKVESLTKAQFLKIIECSFVKANPDTGQANFEVYRQSIASIDESTWQAFVGTGAAAVSIKAQFDKAIEQGCSL